MLARFRQSALQSPGHAAALYGLSISAAIFIVLLGFQNGFDVAIRTALVALVITFIGFRFGLIPPARSTAASARKAWLGRGGRLHGFAAGALVGGFVALAAVASLAAAVVATLAFVVTVGLVSYLSPRFRR
jgi:hypothetical protein